MLHLFENIVQDYTSHAMRTVLKLSIKQHFELAAVIHLNTEKLNVTVKG